MNPPTNGPFFLVHENMDEEHGVNRWKISLMDPSFFSIGMVIAILSLIECLFFTILASS